MAGDTAVRVKGFSVPFVVALGLLIRPEGLCKSGLCHTCYPEPTVRIVPRQSPKETEE